MQMSEISPLDPTRDIEQPVFESYKHTPLPEEYIWTKGNGVNDKVLYTFTKVSEDTEPHFFRSVFQLTKIPNAATLYLAGPRSVEIWLNGQLVSREESDLTSPLGMHVFTVDVQRFLRSGSNTLAIRAVLGRGVTGFANSAFVRQQTFGQVLVAKLIPATSGIEAPSIMHSDLSWRSTTTISEGWQRTELNDSSWPKVLSIGGIESSIDMFQWNADSGLYSWPGYDGISPFLAHLPLRPIAVLTTYAGHGNFYSADSLTSSDQTRFAVHLPALKLTDSEAPSLFLDLGRELAGRVGIISDSEDPLTVSIQMGESESETLRVPYLGINQLTIPPHGIGHSPKSAFRYAKIRFLAGSSLVHLRAIRVDDIYYPVQYAGSLESSDPLINRIWETGVYTAHLRMQDEVWDASTRDRGHWMGDMDGPRWQTNAAAVFRRSCKS
jgi:alpha-L-rhamnosidase